MDQWSEWYINDWLTDCHDPDTPVENELRFIRDILEAFKSFLRDSTVTTEIMGILIAEKVNSQPAPEAKGFLDIFHGFLFSAATTSPIVTCDLAEVTCYLSRELPSQLAQQFRTELGWGAREDWNGPYCDCNPRDAGKESEEGRAQRIRGWVSLSELCAHLARLQVVPYIERFATWAFDFAFDLNPAAEPPGMLDFYVPAAAAWIRVLGNELRHWCVTADNKAGSFDCDTWGKWKAGLEDWRRSGDLHPRTKMVADAAWHTMCDLERLET